MTIKIGSATGIGPTGLAAFDAALYRAGVANFNLLCLSSVIPPQSEIRVFDSAVDSVSGNWGDKLYVVKAEYRQATAGKEAWAGIGWVQDSMTSQGLFVEHEGETEAEVRQDIEQSLQALMKTRDVDYGDINVKVVGVSCDSEPVCALVVAVYESEGWGS